MEADHPAGILFQAIMLIRNVTNCQDVSFYCINGEKYARLFGYTSNKAACWGNTVYLPDKEPLYEVLSRQEVYVNRNMEPEYPMMAYCTWEEEKMNIMILLWSIPFEQMTIGEANRLIVLGKLIQKSVKKSKEYLKLLRNRRYQNKSHTLKAEAFEELVNIYHEAGEKNLTMYILLQVVSTESGVERTGFIVSENLRETDYIGYRKDGNLYILLSDTDRSGCGVVQKRLEQQGVCTVISEGMGL